VNEPSTDLGLLDDYAKFYRNKTWTHEWRHMLRENSNSLSEIMDSQLPKQPEMKNPAYDALKMMTSYSMFANDEGLMAFPPARTYEGPAAGCCMIGSNFEGYADLGFRDGVNCILHRKHDIDDFRDKALYWLQRPTDLERISKAGQMLVRNYYTHELVAQRLAIQLEYIHKTGRRPETVFPKDQSAT
jgi:spore maturation protein CgeB